MKKLTLTMILAAAMSWAVDFKNLEVLAAKASTPAEHSSVAKQYRLHAEQMEVKAQKHEETARQMEARPRTALAHKWPGMGQRPWIAERKQAAEAKRAAVESRNLAEKHSAVTLELLAGQ